MKTLILNNAQQVQNQENTFKARIGYEIEKGKKELVDFAKYREQMNIPVARLRKEI